MNDRWKRKLSDWADQNNVPEEPDDVSENGESVPTAVQPSESTETGLPDEDLEDLRECQDQYSLLKKGPVTEVREPSISSGLRETLKDLIPNLIHTLITKHNIDRFLGNQEMDRQQARQKLNQITHELMRDKGVRMGGKKRDFTAQMVVNEIVGFGPITPLLRDSSINEVMVNGIKEVYVEKNGELERSDVEFVDVKQINRTIEKILRPTNRHVDVSQPQVDARLPDGSRVHVIIPPVAADAPTITIRKFNRDQIDFEQLMDFGTLSEEMAYFLGACVKARLNIVVSGGTSSGKTTLLNAFSSLIPRKERIVTIEDSLELKIKSHHPHVVRLETRDPNIEGQGEVPMRQLVQDALRMRPDRIIVGEVRGEEVMDMLQAMNTGHDGSFTTIHANSPAETVSRLENLALMAGVDIPAASVRNQIATSIDLFVQIKRYQDGSRKINHITEVLHSEEEQIKLKDIFRFRHDGTDDSGKVKGEFERIQRSPEIRERFQQAGLNFPDEMFEGS
ncbi:MAG: CpaF family protein [bacterium]